MPCPGVRVGSLAERFGPTGPRWRRHLARHAPMAGSPFTALSTAFMRDGGFVHVPANTDLTRPVHLVFVTTAAADRQRDPPSQPGRDRDGGSSFGHRELRDPGRGRQLLDQRRHRGRSRRQLLDRAHPDPARERAGLSRRPDPRGAGARQPLSLLLAGHGRRAGASQPSPLA